ncbi:D-arabinono-1,4-lactone oxidase [Subtercola boreus]|uniref:FAD-linked oxidoreductase n=1 Tax=Subtercola boreus TaxID=120213 RepID=A0A3E0W960_9MICO|nr:D-arabinono-1,4-lactone oxidase [Subtercola boreus]RFA20088.1 FAD-linked oxidoreductase [Subtercola boreus]RFA20218.1 FAD-linked oxidoreductase [Subtercola boreus]RFA26543.1 FAD-linked oxidoreductase [Subtercola boreus]
MGRAVGADGGAGFTGAVWRTWGRTEAVRPVRVERPQSVEAVQRAVVAAGRAGLRIKAVGAGHSFTGIAVAKGVQLDVTGLSGVLNVDTLRARVTLGAGTHLWELPRMLAPHGLALTNMGDIDRQSVAGAISTGTHGTGARFGGMASQVRGAVLVTGDGTLLRVSETENAELLPAVAVGLGALGILVEVTLQCVPTFLLHASERAEPLEAVLDALPERVAGADHLEFYWFPHTGTALTKTNTRIPGTDARAALPPLNRFVDDWLVSNQLFRLTCSLGRVAPPIIPHINRVAEKLTGTRDYTDLSPRVFATRRTVRFVEMEYALPAEVVPEVLREIDGLIERRGWRISFPVEVRFAASDDLWLSTAHGRQTGYIAVHRYFREPHAEYFEAVEEIMMAHAGRPHWGKLHTRDAQDFTGLYPRFVDFVALRERLDPARLFANDYLDRVLGA